MLFHLLRATNRLNELFVFATPVVFLSRWFGSFACLLWLFQAGFYKSLCFGSLFMFLDDRSNTINFIEFIDMLLPEFQNVVWSYLDTMLCGIENPSFFRWRFLADRLMFFDSVLVEVTAAHPARLHAIGNGSTWWPLFTIVIEITSQIQVFVGYLSHRSTAYRLRIRRSRWHIAATWARLRHTTCGRCLKSFMFAYY